MRREAKSIGFVKWWYVFLFAIFMVSMMGSKVYAQEQTGWKGNINVLIGQKWLDEDDWRPLEEQFEFGIQTDFRPVTWPISFAVNWSYSTDEGDIYDPWVGSIDIEGRTMEVDLGVRWIYEDLPYVRPFIGGGPSIIWAEAEGSTWGITISDDDLNIGLWIGGGAYVTLAKHLNLGIQAKYSYAKVDLLDVDVKAGGWHIGGLVGFHW